MTTEITPAKVRLSDQFGPPPRWWHCDTHGAGTHTAWGCPECVREMRGEIARLVREHDQDRATLIPLLSLMQEVLSIAAHGVLMDGASVNTPTLLWAKEWARKLVPGPNV